MCGSGRKRYGGRGRGLRGGGGGEGGGGARGGNPIDAAIQPGHPQSVWTEPSEAFSAPHFEIQTGDGHGVAVALHQIFTAEGGIRHDRTILAKLVLCLMDR